MVGLSVIGRVCHRTGGGAMAPFVGGRGCVSRCVWAGFQGLCWFGMAPSLVAVRREEGEGDRGMRRVSEAGAHT